MSVLTLLFLTSMFYFTLAQPSPSFKPEQVAAYQEQVDECVNKINEAVTTFISQIVSLLNLDPEDQDYLKTTTLNGISSYVNYMLYLMTEDSKNDVDDEESDDIIIELESLGPFVPGIPYQVPDDPK